MAWLTEAEYLYWCDIYTGKYAEMERPEWLSRPTVRKAVQRPKPLRRPTRRRAFDLDVSVPDLTAGIAAAAHRLTTESRRQLQQTVDECRGAVERAVARATRIHRFQLEEVERLARRSGRRAGAASR